MNPSRKNIFRKKTSQGESPLLLCRICDKPVSVETAICDADGRAIHDVCYALKIALEQASRDGHR